MFKVFDVHYVLEKIEEEMDRVRDQLNGGSHLVNTQILARIKMIKERMESKTDPNLKVLIAINDGIVPQISCACCSKVKLRGVRAQSGLVICDDCVKHAFSLLEKK